MVSLEGKGVLVTGGSGDIGRAICSDLAARGADVGFTWFRNREAAARTADSIEAAGRRSLAIRAHLGEEGAAKSAVDSAIEGFGRLDHIISTAASGVIRSAIDLRPKHLDWTFDVNARSLVELASAAVPRLPEGAAIVAISSLGSGRVMPGYAAVGASKAALESLVRYLAVELAPRGIRVNAVSAGVVDTRALESFPMREEMLRVAKEQTPAGRMVEPGDVVAAVRFLLSEDAWMIRGQTIVVDGGYSLPA